MARTPLIRLTLVVVAALIYGATTGHDRRLQAAGGDPQSPIFLVEVSHGGQLMFFRDVEGLAPANALPGHKTAGKVLLTRGFSRNRDAWDWRLEVLRGDSGARGEVGIRMVDATFQEVARWMLEDAFPAAVTDSIKDGVAYEQLVLAHNGLTLVDPPAQ